MTLENYLDYLVEYLQTTVKEAHAQGVIVGISGGIDSAVVAYLAKKAFPENYLTVWMPIDSSKLDWDCVDQLVKTNDLKSVTIDLKEPYESWLKLVSITGQPSDLVKANAKARLRMTTVYGIGQMHNYLVLGTDNLDEWYTGYFTKYGDGGVDVALLVHLLKREVRQAAKILNVPEAIINRAPTAGLWEGQTDENELGFSYDEIDDYLLTKKSDNQQLVDRIEKLHQASEHKRTLVKQPNSFQR